MSSTQVDIPQIGSQTNSTSVRHLLEDLTNPGGPKQQHEQGGPPVDDYYIIISAAPSLRRQITMALVLSETVASYNGIVLIALPCATVEQLVTSHIDSIINPGWCLAFSLPSFDKVEGFEIKTVHNGN